MHFGTEQNVGPKPPTVRFEMKALLAGARSTWSFCLTSDFVVLVPSEAVLREKVLVLDGCLNCGNSDRGSRRFAGTCGPMGRIAILEQIEHEHEKQPEQNHAA